MYACRPGSDPFGDSGNNYNTTPEFGENYRAHNWSLQQEPEVGYVYRRHFLAINSKDRDRVAFPNPNNYQVHFAPGSGTVGAGGATTNTAYKNVVKIRLIRATIPDAAASGSVLDEPYLLLKINEVDNADSNFDGTNNELDRAFAILGLDTPYKSGEFFNADLDLVDKAPKIFAPTPLASLDKFTISITDEDGTLFDFGTDTSPPTAPTKGLQNHLFFEIITMDRAPASLNVRGVY